MRSTALMLVAMTFMAPLARAVEFSWNNPGGTATFEDAANWSPGGGPPDAGDDARFGDAGTHTVTINPSKAVESDRLVVEKGDYTFRSAAAGTAQYDVVGAFDINTVFDASLTLGAAGQPVNLNLANDLRVDAAATLDVLHGSSVSGEDLFFGASLGGTNTITVDGAGSSFDFTGVGVFGANGAIANLNFTNGATGSFGKDLTLINFNNADNTEANLTLDSGSSLTVDGSIGVGQSSGSTTGAQSALLAVGMGSTLTQTGTGGVAIGISSSTNTLLDPHLAVSSGGVMTTGTGSTLIRHNGRLSVTGNSSSTYNANGPVVLSPTGSIFLDDGGTINAAAGLDNSADGTILHREGTIRITGGAFIPNSGGDYEVEGLSIGSNTRLVLGAGSTTNITGAFRFGTVQDAHLTVEGGAQLTTGSANLSNANAGSTVTATVGGLGTVWDSGQLDFGSANTHLTIENQAGLASDDAIVRNGQVLIDSSGSWHVDTLELGEAAEVELDNSATLTSQTALIGTGELGTSSIVRAGAHWHNTGEVQLGNLIISPPGSEGAGEIQANAGGHVQIDGPLRLRDTGTFRMNLGTATLNGEVIDQGGVFLFTAGTLRLNDPSATLVVNPDGLYLGTLDLNASNINTNRILHMAGASVVTPSASLTVFGQAHLSRLTVTSGGVVDYRLGVLDVTGPLQAATGSLVNIAGGNAAFGDATVVNGVYIGGEFHVHTNVVTLNDANDAVLDSAALVTLAGGEVVAANGLTLDFGGNITGHGDITTPDDVTKPLTNNGHISGDSMAQPINLSGYVKGVGTMDNVVITGTDAPGFSPAAVTRGSVIYAGSLEIELGGTTPGSEYDQLNHLLGAGTAVLGGTLEVQLIDNFVPSVGDTFDVITALGGITGTFDTESLPSLGLLALEVLYDTNGVSLAVVPALDGDFDVDGDVDGFDFLTWQRNPSIGLLSDWDANFGSVVSPVLHTVPEPCALFLTWVGCFVGMLLNYRKKSRVSVFLR